MNCRHSKVLLADYLDKGLSPTDMAAVKEHLQGCAQCREELNFLKKYKKEMARHPNVNAPDDFLARLRQKIDRTEKKKRFIDIMFFPLKIKLPLEAAGASALALIAIFLFSPFKPEYIAQKGDPAVPHAEQKIDAGDTSAGAADYSSRRSRTALVAKNDRKAAEHQVAPPAETRDAAEKTERIKGKEAIIADQTAEKKEASLPESGELTLYLARTAPRTDLQLKDDRAPLKKARNDLSSEDAGASLSMKENKAEQSRGPLRESEAPAETEIEEIISSLGGSISGYHEGRPKAGRFFIVEVPAENYNALVRRLSGLFSVRRQGTERPQARSGKIRIRLYITR